MLRRYGESHNWMAEADCKADCISQYAPLTSGAKLRDTSRTQLYFNAGRLFFPYIVLLVL
jgi:hypothetical protein